MWHVHKGVPLLRGSRRLPWFATSTLTELPQFCTNLSVSTKTGTQLYCHGEDLSFKPLDCDGTGKVSSKFFQSFLQKNGLRLDTDPRLVHVHKALAAHGALEEDQLLTFEELEQITKGRRNLIRRCIAGKLQVPDFQRFTSIFKTVYERVKPITGGANAAYIPQLAEVDPEQFGIAVCTVDGQQFSIGDTSTAFCIQSCSKPITYMLALRALGVDYVHQHVGTEPSGQRFNEMVLKDAPNKDNPDRKVPHNPLINAGAIITTSMVAPEASDQNARLDLFIKTWRELSGYPEHGSTDCPIGFDEAVYMSESETADRNWCLGFMMKESQSFPACFTTLSDTLELYFKTCAITSTAEAMAVAAASLASGGQCPTSRKRIFDTETVRSVLPIMTSCGMYDYSGEWAYSIGVPAKSGVAGCIFMVVPNVCGIAVWSPRLDKLGNSVRGIAAAKELVNYFQFHQYDVFASMTGGKFNPVTQKHSVKQSNLGDVLYASSIGDVRALESFQTAGKDLYQADYDKRTALHLASAEGRLEVVHFLLEHASEDIKASSLAAKDRWGGTPLDDAVREGHTDCVDALCAAGAPRGDGTLVLKPMTGATRPPIDGDMPIALYAAAEGDLMELIKINASGRCHNIFAGDYDMRTALHLAASEGHQNIVSYLLGQVPPSLKTSVLTATDRFGATPYDDAVREGHEDCAKLLHTTFL